MSTTADVVIVGCGGAGSAAAAELARRGRRVVAFDAFEAGHTRGSSHGTERIVRAAYADEMYSLLVMDALEGWRDLESLAGARLLSNVGSLDHVQQLVGQAAGDEVRRDVGQLAGEPGVEASHVREQPRP
ncbi:MAG: FAD-dependent oxidoreductase, partial [Actinomycetota bacterium]